MILKKIGRRQKKHAKLPDKLFTGHADHISSQIVKNFERSFSTNQIT